MRPLSVMARTALLVSLAIGSVKTSAAPFTSGNILVSGGFSSREIREYTPAGVLVQTLPVAMHPGNQQLRDLVLDESSVLHVYHGTFSPLLRSYSGSWSSATFAGWSTANNVTYGGIAATDGFVFVTDMDAPDQGIVRFDTTAGFAATRFADSEEYIDLTIGLDCRLYALRSNSVSTQTVDVFDPLTMSPLGSVVLSLGGPAMDLRGIAVAANGGIFAGAWDQNIYHFDTAGQLVNSLATGGLVSDINLNASGDIVAAQWLGQLIMTTTALSSFSSFDPGLANFFVAHVGGEQAASCPCSGSQDLTAGQWRMISLPCGVGASDTVEDVFGDDLDALDYGVRWGMFERDEVAQVYHMLGLGDPLNEGEGYWIKTLDAGQSVSVDGEGNAVIDVALVSDVVDGVQNLVGHPFDIDVCWADVEVVDGANVLSLDQADPLIGMVRACAMVPPDPSCVMSRVGHRWNGAAYGAFDGETPGLQGTLSPFDGVWVKAFKPAIALRIPATEGTGCTFSVTAPPPPTVGSEKAAGDAQRMGSESYGRRRWTVRLVAESGDLRDADNVLGQLEDALDGYDYHDLPEPAPFDAPYLSIVFPHAEWAEQAGDYTSDFRRPYPKGEWRFDVIGSGLTAPVTLRWAGDGQPIRRAVLVDEETGETLRVKPRGSFTFDMGEGGRRSFRWLYGGGRR